ncbi:hypothetical protein [Streptomyces pacificus]|uniref:Uncharacterized protein n=1 Tax=Streptomyces pacificus TaxID=2705029 RepID=A0A6A0B008_9ACTN|nr:hypothetical protein [Streptomyces pacificus]GFH38035.1 hypothetical protein SCWH03_42750 [Streptomyces pacificus]
MNLMSCAKRPLRTALAGAAAGLATVALTTAAGAAAVPAPYAMPASYAAAAAAASPTEAAARHLSAGLPTPRQVSGTACGRVDGAARGAAAPQEALAFCKRVNGWD